MELGRREVLNILNDNRAVPAAVLCASAQVEVFECQNENARAPLSVAEPSGVAANAAHHGGPVEGSSFPVQCAVDNERIEHDMEMEFSGIP